MVGRFDGGPAVRKVFAGVRVGVSSRADRFDVQVGRPAGATCPPGNPARPAHRRDFEKMMNRFALATAAFLAVAVSHATADACWLTRGLFGGCGHGCNDCYDACDCYGSCGYASCGYAGPSCGCGYMGPSCAVPSCAAPAAPTCCAPSAPSCCAPSYVAPTCAAPAAPSCCAPCGCH